MDQSELKQLLNYDKDTGLFTWRKRVSPTADKNDIAGHVDTTGYRIIRVRRKGYLAHRLAWLYEYGTPPSMEVDHINGKKDDNRICNLRIVSHRQNKQNIRNPRADNTSGYLGVSARRGRWQATIGHRGRQYHLGDYDTPEEAHQAYMDKKRDIHSYNTLEAPLKEVLS